MNKRPIANPSLQEHPYVLKHPTEPDIYLGAGGTLVGPDEALMYHNPAIASFAALLEIDNDGKGVRWVVTPVLPAERLWRSPDHC